MHRDSLRVVAGIMLAGGLVSTSPPVSQTQGGPMSMAGTFSFRDLEEVGAFRMPAEGAETTFELPGIAGRVVNGEQRIFVYARGLVELRPPDTLAPFAQYEQAPRATLRRRWTGVWGDLRKSWTRDGVLQPSIPNLAQGEMYFDEVRQWLLFTYYDSYNAGAQPHWNLAAVRLDPEIARFGPWRVRVRVGNGWAYGAERSYYLQDDPRDGSLLTGSTIVSNNRPYPWGPSLARIPVWPTAETPSGYRARDLEADKVYVDHPISGFRNGVPEGTWTTFKRRHNIVPFEASEGAETADPAKNGGVSSWQQRDRIGGFAAISNGQKDAVFFFAELTGTSGVPVSDPANCKHGHTWYNNPGAGRRDSHGCADPLGNTGPTYTDRLLGVYTYRREDLDRVAAGRLAPHRVDPVEFVDLTARGVALTPSGMSDPGNFSCCYINRQTRMVYGMSNRVEGQAPNIGDRRSVVWVWRYPAARTSASR